MPPAAQGVVNGLARGKSRAMTFAHQLTKAAGDCTAAEAATAVSALLSRRTMEDWLQGRRTPPEWTHDFILARVSARARRKSRRPQNDPVRNAGENNLKP